jgi:hypothetical protein
MTSTANAAETARRVADAMPIDGPNERFMRYVQNSVWSFLCLLVPRTRHRTQTATATTTQTKEATK